jgi:hypothetical protein
MIVFPTLVQNEMIFPTITWNQGRRNLREFKNGWSAAGLQSLQFQGFQVLVNELDLGRFGF